MYRVCCEAISLGLWWVSPPWIVLSICHLWCILLPWRHTGARVVQAPSSASPPPPSPDAPSSSQHAPCHHKTYARVSSFTAGVFLILRQFRSWGLFEFAADNAEMTTTRLLGWKPLSAKLWPCYPPPPPPPTHTPLLITEHTLVV